MTEAWAGSKAEPHKDCLGLILIHEPGRAKSPLNGDFYHGRGAVVKEIWGRRPGWMTESGAGLGPRVLVNPNRGFQSLRPALT